jgi:hypothetical protein
MNYLNDRLHRILCWFPFSLLSYAYSLLSALPASLADADGLLSSLSVSVEREKSRKLDDQTMRSARDDSLQRKRASS